MSENGFERMVLWRKRESKRINHGRRNQNITLNFTFPLETSIDLPRPENRQHETDVAKTRGCSGTVGIRRIAEEGKGGREEGSEKNIVW